MKYLAILTLLGLPAAGLAQQRPAQVIAFNGHYIEIDLASSHTPTNYDPADEKADQLCDSVGKVPELQYRETVAQGRFKLFYVCL